MRISRLRSDPDETLLLFFLIRTPTGKESKHAYVRGLREAAANLADDDRDEQSTLTGIMSRHGRS